MKLKTIISLVLTLLFSSAGFAAQNNYEITVNGDKREISLGTEYQMKTHDGKTIKFKVEQKPIATYEDDFITFKYKSDLNLIKKDATKESKQLVLTTAAGTLVMVQEHRLNIPASMNDLMLSQLTKQDMAKGYKMSSAPFQKILKDGKKIEGVKATMNNGSKEHYFTVATYGKGSQGILVVTRLNKDSVKQEGPILDLLWDSLTIKF